MRAHCLLIQKRFHRAGVTASVSLSTADFFPDAIIRHAHAHPGSLIVTMQDADFHLVEVFQGTFTKKVLHSILSPVLVIPPSVRKSHTAHG
jgi:nucleotide-binding universal stress UspA family protein